jgi:hypothetical protein
MATLLPARQRYSGMTPRGSAHFTPFSQDQRLVRAGVEESAEDPASGLLNY